MISKVSLTLGNVGAEEEGTVERKGGIQVKG